MDDTSKPRIQKLTIENFRAFRRLEIDGIGRVNLLTGENNTGKSSVLEALRILASDASPDVIKEILHFREEGAAEQEETSFSTVAETIFAWSSLFNGFPAFSPSLLPIVIASNGPRRPYSVSLQATAFIEEWSDEGRKRTLVDENSLLFDENEDAQPALRIVSGEQSWLMPLRQMYRYAYRARSARLQQELTFTHPCIYVNPYGGERTTTLGSLWDKIALSDHEQDIVNALQIIDAGIHAVTMVGGEESRKSRTAIVRSNEFQRPVPLRSYGDGLNRLFGIVLSLVNAKGGLLLIDEFENGLHHTVQRTIWHAIFRLAKQLDVQVFATSHSYDAIKAFQVAASDSPEDGVLIRLTRKGDDIIPTVFDEQDLAVVTEGGIEVR